MRVLLDSQAFLWFVMGDSRISAAAKAQIEDPAFEKLISPSSYWEIAIKVSVGKLSLTEPFDVLIPREIHNGGFVILPISIGHAASVVTLPYHHRDPFDRMLIAQAIVEKISVVSSDGQFDAYGVNRIW
jgi:PIN domain nuclease of toxin-antitoxin system